MTEIVYDEWCFDDSVWKTGNDRGLERGFVKQRLNSVQITRPMYYCLWLTSKSTAL